MPKNTDPKYVCQNILPRDPAVIKLFCTKDGRELFLKNDGGTFRNGKLVGPNPGAANAYSAIAKRDDDGMPVFVAREQVLPSYDGDPLCTSTKTYAGAITLLAGDANKAAVDVKIKKHVDKLKDIAADAQAKLDDEAKKK